MKKLSVIAIVLLASTLLIGVVHTFVFASEGGEVPPASNEATATPKITCTPTPTPTPKLTCTPTPKEETPTPTEVSTVITEIISPTATAAAAFTPTEIPTATLAAATSAPVETTNTSSGGGSAAGQAGNAIPQAQAASVNSQSAPQGQVLGSSSMAPTGSFQSKLMKLYGILGIYLLLAGYASFAKEKRYN